jgi:predicted transposase/invertase (TIGR01784 family)
MDNVRDLLRSALPEKVVTLLDLDAIKLSEDSFIDEKLSLYQSDILIRAKIRSPPVLVYVLVDHKSYPDRWTLLQLLTYMVRIWEKELSQRKSLNELPCIIPIIFYHGIRKWTRPLDFKAYFSVDEELNAYVPDFQSAMFNLQQADMKALDGSIMFQVALKAFKYAAKGLRPHLQEILKSISDLPIDSKTRTFLSRLIVYIITVGGDLDVETLKKDLQSVESELSREVFMTIEEQILERGKVAEKQQVLLRLLERKFGPLNENSKRLVAENTNPEKLDTALDLILDADSIAEVLKPLL